MPAGTIFDAFPEIVLKDEPLAPYTYLKVGGPAEALVQPRSREELAAVVAYWFQQRLPLCVLGGGCNVLVPDEGVRGVVLRLSQPPFKEVVAVDSRRVRAGTGAPLSASSHSSPLKSPTRFLRGFRSNTYALAP